MDNITVKIYQWEETTQSLICGFASNTTKSSNPDEYNKFSFQPHLMWPEATTTEEILKNIAQAGRAMCQEAEKREDIEEDIDRKNVFKSLVGTNQTFNTSDLD